MFVSKGIVYGCINLLEHFECLLRDTILILIGSFSKWDVNCEDIVRLYTKWHVIALYFILETYESLYTQWLTQLGDVHLDGLVQERRNSSASAMELRLPCINPSI